MKPLPFALAAILALAVPGPLAADPRWWWDDVQVTSTPTDSADPHLALIPADMLGGGFLIAYTEQDPSGGGRDIWLTASFDAGCTFCPPTRITSHPADETRPRVAAVTLPSAMLSLAIAFEREGEIQLAWDSATVNTLDVPSVACNALGSLGNAIRSNNQFVTLSTPGVIAEHPDIAAVSNFSFQHFHAVWTEERGGSHDVFHARDLTGLGGTGWTATPARNVSALSGGAANVEPAIEVDMLTDPDPLTGNVTLDRSAVNLVWVLDGSPLPVDALMGVRSVDSGDTFSPLGDRVNQPPVQVDDGVVAGDNDLRSPALDTGYLPWDTQFPAWIATSFDRDVGGATRDIGCDARFHSGPNLAAPDWQAPDSVATSATLPLASDPTTAVLLEPGGGGASIWNAWTDERSGSAEVVYRPGVLDRSGGRFVDLDAFPIPVMRPLDPSLSEVFQLSHCEFDDATFGCPSSRTSGEAAEADLEANMEDVLAVWADNRSGSWNIYFKRTDRWIAANTVPRLSVGCVDSTTAFIDVEFDVAESCPLGSGWERMERYLVYHGTDPGGPFVNAANPIEVLHDPSLGSVVTARIDGLSLGTTYQVIVVPEDEARNVNPPRFDPSRDAVNAHGTERAITTPDPCQPVLAVDCTVLGDRCPADPAISGDTNFDFGERIDLELTIMNSGPAPLTNYTAGVTVSGATLLDPPSGQVVVPLVPIGGSVTVPLVVELPDATVAACGAPVDLTLVAQAADGPVSFPDQPLAGCAFQLGQPTGQCDDCGLSPEVVVARCEVVADRCPGGSGPGHQDGIVDPGESLELEIELVNVGGSDAVDFSARVDVPAGGTIASGAAIGPVTLAAGGGSVVHRVTVDVTAGCGDLLDLDVVDLESDGGTFTYSAFTSCDRRVGGNLRPLRKVYRSPSSVVLADDGSPSFMPLGLDPVEPAPVERAVLTLNVQTQDPANIVATLWGPSGSLDVTAAINSALDVTADYNGALGGAGHHDIEFRKLTPNGQADFAWQAALEIEDVVAECSDCSPAGPTCLYRSDVLDVSPHAPPHGAIYLPSRTAAGIALQGTAYQCPFSDGDSEPDANALTNGVNLVLYQVDLPVNTLRLSKQGTTIRFRF